jgi:hypothetical protein
MTEEEIEQILLARRLEARKLFGQLIDDEKSPRRFVSNRFCEFKTCYKTLVIDRPLGKDYLPNGMVEPEQFELAFEQGYGDMPHFYRIAWRWPFWHITKIKM